MNDFARMFQRSASPLRHALVILVALLLVLSGCASDEAIPGSVDEPTDSPEVVDEEVGSEDFDADENVDSDDGGDTGDSAVDEEAENGDSPDDEEAENDDSADGDAETCDPEDVGEDNGPLVVIYWVEDGSLGPVCYGGDELVVREAWETLTGFTPVEELRHLGLFAGYTSEDSTLAFAVPVGEVNNDFAIAVDVVASEEDPQELRLTMAHEFAHVFTQTQDQLDIDIGPEACGTYWNGFGCFEYDSYLDQWITQFWSEDALAELPEDGGTDEPGGEDRCVIDPTFLGSYAASHPEEDFAESFSAFVLDLPVPAGVEPKLDFFEQFDELVVFRDLARQQGEDPPPNNFDRCG